MKYGWNGSAPDYSQILRGKKQKKVRFTIIIYYLDTIEDFEENNYSFKFNVPSFREFDNVYNEEYMNLFCYYPIVMI